MKNKRLLTIIFVVFGCVTGLNLNGMQAGAQKKQLTQRQSFPSLATGITRSSRVPARSVKAYESIKLRLENQNSKKEREEGQILPEILPELASISLEERSQESKEELPKLTLPALTSTSTPPSGQETSRVSLRDETAIDIEEMKRDLQEAILKGHADSVYNVLKHGALPIDIVYGLQGEGILHLIAQYDHLDVLQKIKDLSGLSLLINRRTTEGYTPLYLAAYYGSPKVAKALLELGADQSVSSNHGSLPIIVAGAYGHTEIVNLLVEKNKLVIHKREKLGYTVMHYAAQQGHPKTVAALIKAGASVHAKSYAGITPLDLANNAILKTTADRGGDYWNVIDLLTGKKLASEF